MISMPLFRREARRSILLLVIFPGILVLYASVILTMYDPELGDSLAMMKDAMRELFAAFGMSDPGSTLTEFLANYLYGFLFLVLPLVLLILLTNRLVVGYLDQGTMAWLLSTPTPRWKIAATQAMLHVVCAALIVVYAGGLCAILSAIMYSGELAVGPFFRLNLTLAALLCLLGSICFLGACALPDSRQGLALGGGLCVVFLLLQMLAGGPLVVAILLGRFGHKVHLVTYTSPGASLMLREVGICLFLASVGISAGGEFVNTIMSGGLVWVWWGFLITVIPLLVIAVIARAHYKINYCSIMGLLSGACTDPPALAYANKVSGNDAPSVAYSTVYPLTMFLRVLSAQLLILLFY